MRKCVATVFAASALFLAGCCTPPHAARWEYKVVSAPPFGFAERTDPEGHRTKLEALLNDMGKDGWILVSQTDGRMFYFRRSLKP